MRVAVCGQLITSRTETIESFLKGEVDELCVIGITSPFSPKNVSRCTLYSAGRAVRNFGLPGLCIPRMKPYKQPLLAVSFLLYFFSIVYAAISSRRRSDVFIGVSCFSALVGVFLKSLGLTRRLVYYCIDYYIMPRRLRFNTFVIKAFQLADAFCVRHADLTWHISPKIEEARMIYAGIPADAYRHLVFPLTYAAKMQRMKPPGDIEPYTIGFVGTITENQGLELVVRAMPLIAKNIPQIKVRIIGRGPYERQIKARIEELGLGSRFIFHGFIKNEEEVLDILSSCAIGAALWEPGEDNNIKYADPGKPKLYAFCGIPTVITDVTPVARELESRRAGICIGYSAEELCSAVSRILSDKEMLAEYKKNSFDFARDYTTENILGPLFSRSLGVINREQQ